MADVTISQAQRRAAEAGEAEAQYRLAGLYGGGRGVPLDEREAAAWYRRAAEQGHAGAQCSLGWMHQHGRGVAQDEAEAAAWYRRAAGQGHREAQANLGWLLQNGRGAARDDAEAAAWYGRAAEQGEPCGQCSLGWMYEHGRGVPRDDVRAAAWYRQAAEQGHREAQFSLGRLCQEGRGVPQDLSEAAEWYGKAARNGLADAQNNLGLLCEAGAGIEKNADEARRWFEAASAQGHEGAKANLARLQNPAPAGFGPASSEPRPRPCRAKPGESCRALLAACTPSLYRRNVFRLTGLPVDATARQIKRRIDDLRAAEELGEACCEHTHVFALSPPPSLIEIREAVHRLNDPESRVIEELFWFWPAQWGGSERDPAIKALARGDLNGAHAVWAEALSSSFGAPLAAAKHNLAVLYHLAALDLEHDVLIEDLDAGCLEPAAEYWRAASEGWEELALGDYFWSVVEERLRRLDDPRLDAAFALRLRATLPEAVERINALLALAFMERGRQDLALRHVTRVEEAGPGDSSGAAGMAAAIEPLLERLKTAISNAEMTADTKPEAANAAAANLLQLAREPLAILRKFLPAGDPRLEDVCDSIAGACLKCHHACARAAPDDPLAWEDALDNLTQAREHAIAEELKTEASAAYEEAAQARQLKDPRIAGIAALLERARTEPLERQLDTLGKETAAALKQLADQAGTESEGYRLASDRTAFALRGLSVDLVNRGQAALSQAIEALEEERKREGPAAEGRPDMPALEERKWEALLEVAIGLDLYDRGRKLAQTRPCKERFAADTEALAPLRRVCGQVCGELYDKRLARGLLFRWITTPPERK